MTLQSPKIRHFFLQSVYGIVLLHDLIRQAANLFLLSVHFGSQLPALLRKLYAFDSQIFYHSFQFLYKRERLFIPMTTGEKIKHFRNLRGISQETLDHLSGINSATIKKI